MASDAAVNTPPVILVDGSSYLFRAFHALPPLTNSAGHPTGAIKGVLSMLRKLRATYDPKYMVVVFDAKGKTFRHDMYEAYKANRPPMPDALAEQIKPLHNIIRAMGIPLVVRVGVEADDVIGTLARQAQAAGHHVLISTGDKDMAQLVNEQVTLINTMKDEIVDVAGVEKRYGVKPEQIIDYLALLGDKSDNVPGLPGVGEKTARALLAHYADIPQLIAEAEDAATLGIRGGKSLPAKIADNEAQLKLSRELVTIDCSVDLVSPQAGGDTVESLEALVLGEPDVTALTQFYETFEFKNWLEEVTRGVAPEVETPPVSYDTVTTPEQLSDWIARLSDAALIAFDTETTGLDYMTAELVGLSFACAPGEACYIPLAHTGPGVTAQLPLQETLAALKPVFENADIQSGAKS